MHQSSTELNPLRVDAIALIILLQYNILLGEKPLVLAFLWIFLRNPLMASAFPEVSGPPSRKMHSATPHKLVMYSMEWAVIKRSIGSGQPCEPPNSPDHNPIGHAGTSPIYGDPTLQTTPWCWTPQLEPAEVSIYWQVRANCPCPMNAQSDLDLGKSEARLML